jgi:serine/threonine protein kinase
MSSQTPQTLPEPAFPVHPRFEARGIVGRGANGIVYRALDAETGVEVALKTLSSVTVEQIYHLKAEFRSLSQIVHPNLVRLDELVVESDACFFTMELLDGQTFGEYACDLAVQKQPREWTAPAMERLRRIVVQLAAGIAALHEAGKLHRDIKPTNILVTKDERAVLVDFGLCVELRRVERAKSQFVGTLRYMAPELDA